MATENDLIAAEATPPSLSAIAVVRLSGRGASKAVETAMGLPEGRLRGMRRAMGDLGGIDSVVAVSWPRGKSYTGEEMVDIMCHGIPGISSAIVSRLESLGARKAGPGEFTRRAWMNGRVTAVDILSLSARIAGQACEAGAAGDIPGVLDLLLEEVEAVIEFEEDHGEGSLEALQERIAEAAVQAAAARKELRLMEILPRLYIMGPVNAGKSTLFNCLCGSERALVTDVPGTTRDGARATVLLSGRRVEIVDTAGTGGDDLDGRALEIALAGMRGSDRIAWLDPREIPPPPQLVRNRRTMLFHSRADEERGPAAWPLLSAATGEGIEKVMEFALESEATNPSSSMERIEALLSSALESARLQDLALSAECIREAIGELRREQDWGSAVERALERFCVGK
jgi:tRNA modification GTPase